MVVLYLDRQGTTCVVENYKLLKSIAEVTILCARQDIPLRGHNEGIDSVNKENFKEILELLSSESDQLWLRIEQSAANVRYTSNDTQNDILKSTSAIVLRYLTNEIRNKCRHFKRLFLKLKTNHPLPFKLISIFTHI